jgi:hypothetical protein
MQLEVITADVAAIQNAVREAQGSIAQAAAAIEFGLAKVVNAGRMLKAARERFEHGEWMSWLKENVLDPLEITYQTTRNWIKLAEFAERKGTQLDNSSTVRQAYQLAGILPEAESSSGSGGKEAGNYLVHISRLERAIRTQVEARPIAKWSREDRMILKQRLQPLVAIFEELDAA